MKKYLSTISLFLYATIFYAQPVLVWSDEFNSEELDEKNWNILTGYGSQNDGWGNNELQNYTQDNLSFENGNLIITARRTGDKKERGDYTSSRITSRTKQEFLYGRIEARIKLPRGKGVWAAFWMLGANGKWPDCGEIDILEYVGYDQDVAHSALHNRSSFGSTVNKGKTYIKDLENDFHVYGINWSEEKIEFYIDNPAHPFYTYAPVPKTPQNWPFDKPHYIIFNFAVGGHWGGKEGIDNSVFPQQYIIDWVRVYSN